MVNIKNFIHERCRGFSHKKYFRLRSKYYTCRSRILKYFLYIKILKIESRNSAIIGLAKHKDVFASPPILPHGLLGIVINKEAVIGKNCTIFQFSSIVAKDEKVPVIGDNCFIGTHAVILGGIKIGNNCKIGAQCIVCEDVPDNTTVVMQKVRYIYK